MDSAVEFYRVAPVLSVRDLDSALDRYRALGFSVTRYEGPERYAFVEHGLVSMHLSEWHEHDPARTGGAVYLYVSDADALYAQWARAAVPGRLSEPADRAYGLREFSYLDPDGTLHRVGSPLSLSE